MAASCEDNRIIYHGSFVMTRSRLLRLPATLDEISQAMLPDRPSDPFTGKPFVYKPDPDGKGFLLYSVGPDGKDDGGSIAAAKYPPPPDLGIHWKLP
jgi:hypothetical protein